jgi:hypothetical protein
VEVMPSGSLRANSSELGDRKQFLQVRGDDDDEKDDEKDDD